MPTEIVIVADIWVRPEHEERVLELLRDDIEHTHANEPGVARFALHRDVDDPLHYTMVEAFADQAALDAHRATDVYRAVMSEIDGLLDRRGRVVLQPVVFGDPGKGRIA